MAAGRRPRNLKVCFPSPRMAYGRQSGSETYFSSTTYISPSQYHTTKVQYLLIYIIYILSNAERHSGHTGGGRRRTDEKFIWA
jgi:hypothetical protein